MIDLTDILLLIGIVWLLLSLLTLISGGKEIENFLMSRPVTWGHIATFVWISPGYLLLVFVTYAAITGEAIFTKLCNIPLWQRPEASAPEPYIGLYVEITCRTCKRTLRITPPLGMVTHFICPACKWMGLHLSGRKEEELDN